MIKPLPKRPPVPTYKYIFTAPVLHQFKIGAKVWDSDGVIVIEAESLKLVKAALVAKIGGHYYATIYPYHDFSHWKLFSKGVILELKVAHKRGSESTPRTSNPSSRTCLTESVTQLF